MQHLVRLRWEELSPQECRDLVNVSIELMSEVANACESWPLKSQSASLVAEVGVKIALSIHLLSSFVFSSSYFSQINIFILLQIVRRHGPNHWQEIFTLLASSSAQGPLQVECSFIYVLW